MHLEHPGVLVTFMFLLWKPQINLNLVSLMYPNTIGKKILTIIRSKIVFIQTFAKMTKDPCQSIVLIVFSP